MSGAVYVTLSDDGITGETDGVVIKGQTVTITLIDYLSWRDNIMSRKIRTEAVDSLFDAVLSLKSREECYTFFEDVCTINELLSLSQRFEVAKMLRDQKTYLEIAEKTGASTATISRVNRSLNYGNDGYDMVFERLQAGAEESES